MGVRQFGIVIHQLPRNDQMRGNDFGKLLG